MKYIYWGSSNSGKTDILLRCTLENKTFLLMMRKYIRKGVPEVVDENIINRHSYDLCAIDGKYQEVDLGKITFDKRRNRHFYYREPSPQVAINKKQTKSQLKIFKEGYERRDKYENVYNYFESLKPELEKADYISVGNIGISIKELLEFNNTVHIIPYKIIKDPEPLIPIINMYKNGNFFDLYKTNKNKAFAFIDGIFKGQREIEKYLIKNNIDITYFDLGTYDYTVCGLHSHRGQNLSKPYFNLNNQEVKKRYDLAYSIAQEYLDTRCLTDTRIRGAVIDGIEL